MVLIWHPQEKRKKGRRRKAELKEEAKKIGFMKNQWKDRGA